MAELSTPDIVARPRGSATRQDPAADRLTVLRGWGRVAPTAAELVPVRSYDDAVRAVKEAGPRGVLARGLGRSYGDAAQNAGGTVLDLTTLDSVQALDLAAGTVTVEAGASLEQLMRMLLPFGLFVPVTPGTRYVTVGGAIAADIHGKNHHVSGSFCESVLSLDLLTADGSVRTVTPQGDPALFWATAGGMGLTGVVLSATLRLLRVETSRMLVDTERARDLDDLLDRLTRTDEQYTYSVAWIDLLRRGPGMGRSVLTRGRHAALDELRPKQRRDPLRFDPQVRLAAPPWLPSGLLNGTTVRAFNEVWFGKAPLERRGEVQDIAPFFHPLDFVADWNRIYGPRGFVQYQLVVPLDQIEALRSCVERISASGFASFLAVLKRFGEGNPGPLSFPMAGWTLALDLPATPGLGALLDELDVLVLAAGGRLYLAKDSRVPAEALRHMYPRLDDWLAVRADVDPEGLFRSDLARRLDLARSPGKAAS